MDIRSQRTKQAISECFLELLRDKPAARITVTELCAGASINRATFYKHYLDVADLQSSLEQELLREFETFLQDYQCAGEGKYRQILADVLEYFQRCGARFYQLCSENAGSELPAATFRLFYRFTFPILQRELPHGQVQQADLLYRFLTHGCGALLVCWLRGDHPMPAQAMADFMMTLCSAAVGAVSGREQEG